MTDHITIPRALLEQALEALTNSTPLILTTASADRHDIAISAIRAELAKPVESSHTAMQLAAMVLSDCGISTDHTALHERVAERIALHDEQLIDSLQKLSKPVTDVVITKNKSGQIVAVTLQDEDGRVIEVIDKSTPTPAWHDAPTEPGLWVQRSNLGSALEYVRHEDMGAQNWPGRWFGPIPQDGEKS